MKYIDKSKYIAPPAYAAELSAHQLDEHSIKTSPYWSLSSRVIFEKHVKKLNSFNSMKDSLLADQGYVCCYCNRRISRKGFPVEHVIPKGIKKEWIGEYKNMLVSCQGGNPLPPAPPGGVPFTMTTYEPHCDHAKGEDTIPVTPLMSDCEDRFVYKLSGKITEKNGDTDAKTTIGILNLNQRYLKIERRKEIRQRCYNKNGTLKSAKELEQVFNDMFTKDSHGRYPNLYFVIANVIMGLI